MNNVDEVVTGFLSLSGYEIASSNALREYLETKEYIALTDESVFSLAMKLVFEYYQ